MARMAVRLGWTRSPLRRGTDRFEGWLNAVLILALLVAGTSLAWYAARVTYRDAAGAEAWDRAHRHQVWAVLLERPAADTARARWTGPDGSVHVGAVPSDPGPAAGAWLPVWVDDQGAVTEAPVGRSPAAEAVQVAIVVVLITATVLAAVRLIVCGLLDRRRLRAWQAEWTEVGPRWSRYR